MSPEPVPSTMRTARGLLEQVVAGDGPAVLALHGAMGGWDQSLLLSRTIGEPSYQVVAVSRPGYLGTPLASGRLPEEQADLFAAALDALGIGSVAVMAVSGGGPSAIHFALRHADRCWGLILVSTTGARVDERLPLSFHLLRLLGRWPRVIAAMERRARRDPDRSTRRSIPDPDLRARTMADPEAGPLLRELNASTVDRMAQRLPGTLNDVDVTRRYDYPLERIRVPALVVHGTGDRFVPFAKHGKVLASRIPGAELVAVEGGDHVAIFTHHATVKPRVVAFLRAHAPGKPADQPSDPAATA